MTIPDLVPLSDPDAMLLMAQHAIHVRCGDPDRRWFRVGHLDSYGVADNRIEFHVLQGSPPRGWVAVHRNGQGVVTHAIAYNSGGRIVGRFDRQSMEFRRP